MSARSVIAYRAMFGKHRLIMIHKSMNMLFEYHSISLRLLRSFSLAATLVICGIKKITFMPWYQRQRKFFSNATQRRNENV